MSGAFIAAEVDAALREVAGDVGSGSFTVTIKRTDGGSSTPWGGVESTVIEFEAPAMVSMYPKALVDGTLIRTEDRRVFLSATGVAPTVDDKASFDGCDYSILNVTPYAPSGVPLYYELQARA